ncbi:protein BFR2-like [Hevea brasiliensis]|uniref:protein BFR2-like n=1 Tax=Hevea brasiliensis TaxID=3981 RepID=UPI0025E8589D|nr:protein BFR2-like [Hevea brasiliensis]XP_057992967.1 protein BFR2-like [Hevea brasiliensis]
MASPVTMTKLFKNCKSLPIHLLRGSSSIPMETKIVGKIPSPISVQYFLGSQPNLGSVHHGTINGINTLLLSRFHGSKGYGRRKYPTDDDDDDDDDDDLVGEDIVDDYENDNNEFDFDDDDDDDDDAPAQKRNK